MARVAVDVVIKPEILDPQGKAILLANPVIETWTVSRLGGNNHHSEPALAAPEAAL